MKLKIDSKKQLNNGVKIPILGLGTWKISGKNAINVVIWALEVGYRHIDTAKLYNNETQIGLAIKESDISREDIFITSKVWNTDQGYQSTIKALDISLKKLNTTYVDLYLIHWPRKMIRKDTWKALEKIYKEGKARAIGVSNYWIHHLQEILNSSSITPAINQFELNPFLYRKELIDFCKENDILIEAYCPLTHGRKLRHPLLAKMAKKYNKSIAQILIRWGLQHDFIEIPKSSIKDHIVQNSKVFDFELGKEDMHKLDNIDETYQYLYDTSKWD
ncbi:MAG: aldo/keto reductase [Candidatus Thorarchaeota archaeon]